LKVLVDIDGTLAKFSLFGKILLKLPLLNKFGVRYPNNLFKRIVVFLCSWIYGWVRKPNQDLISHLQILSRRGHTIYIFSAVPDISRQRKVIEKWLRAHKVPFKGIFLMQKNETPIEFKLRIVKKVKPDFVYEDSVLILEKILEKHPYLIARLP